MSTTADPKTRYTPEEVLALPDSDHFELVRGKLVERNVGVLSSMVAVNLIYLLAAFCKSQGWTWLFDCSCGYRCFPNDPMTFRRPDVSFIRQDRMSAEELKKGFILIPPDLAVEVVSPKDLAYEIGGKIEEYLSAGVPLIWVVNPEQRTVHVYRADGSVSLLHERDEMSGEHILPGFRCHVSELFLPAA